MPNAPAATASGDMRSAVVEDWDPTLPESSVAAPGAVVVVSSEVDTATVSGADNWALAKLVIPSTPAPVATTNPAETAILMKRDVVLMVGVLSVRVRRRRFPAMHTFATSGKKSP
jgi:hypothetical protein